MIIAEGIVCIIFILGLLNFAKDAPQLLKDLLGKAGLLKGLDLNPKGQFKKNIATAKETVHKAGSAVANGVKSVYNAPNNIKKGVMSKVGGGIGGLRGMATGFKTNSGQGIAARLSGALSGGAAGRTAGSMAGELGQLRSASSWATKSGEEAAKYTAEMKKNFNDSKTKYGTMMEQFNDANKKEVTKWEEKRDERKAKFKSDVAATTDDLVKNPGWINNATNQSIARTHLKNKLIEDYAKSHNMKVDDVRNDMTLMNDFQHQADNANIRTAVQAWVEDDLKGQYERDLNSIEYNIANAKAKGLEGQDAAVQMTLANLQNEVGDWGKQFADDMQEQFAAALKGIKNPEIVAALNNAGLGDIAGANQSATLDLSNISSIAEGLQSAGQTMALSQIMNAINTAAGKVNTNASIMTTANNTYNPQPTNDNNSGGSGH